MNASLSQNQFFYKYRRPFRMLRYRDRATPLNNDGMIKLGDIHYQTEPNFSVFRRWLINDDFSLCSQILLTVDLQFFLLKILLLNVPL